LGPSLDSRQNNLRKPGCSEHKGAIQLSRLFNSSGNSPAPRVPELINSCVVTSDFVRRLRQWGDLALRRPLDEMHPVQAGEHPLARRMSTVGIHLQRDAGPSGAVQPLQRCTPERVANAADWRRYGRSTNTPCGTKRFVKQLVARTRRTAARSGASDGIKSSAGRVGHAACGAGWDRDRLRAGR
jgi:hypothetical protein